MIHIAEAHIIRWITQYESFSQPKGNESGRIPEPFTDVEAVLARLGLIAEDGALTNAASELFCAHRFGYPRLKMGFLAGNTKADILDLKQESGPMLDLLDRAEVFVISNIRRRLVIGSKGMEREEVPEIPAEAIREAVANALCHRDYTAGAAVEVNVYMDTVQVVSPGLFSEGDSPELHLSGEASALNLRNPKIADVLFRAGVIEQYGSGIPRIKRACGETGVAFECADTPNFTALVFRRPGSQLEGGSEEFASSSQVVRKQFANENEEAVYAYLMANGPAGPTAIANAVGMTRRGAQKLLQRLVEQGLLEAKGATSNRAYYLAQEG